MGRITRLQNQIADLQVTLCTRNKAIEQLTAEKAQLEQKVSKLNQDLHDAHYARKSETAA